MAGKKRGREDVQCRYLISLLFLILIFIWSFNFAAVNNVFENPAPATGRASSIGYVNVTVNASNDIFAPIITLVSPNDGSSISDTSVSFVFKVGDANNISNCSVIIDSSAAEVFYNVTRNVEHTHIGNLAIGNHNWSVSCTDSFNNIGTSSLRNITITAAPAPSPSTGGGGGYGGGKESEINLTRRFRLSMMAGDSIIFDNICGLCKNRHSLKVISIGSNSVNIVVQSSPQYFTMYAGQKIEVDLEGDSAKELAVTLNSISGNSAEFTFECILPEEMLLAPPIEKLPFEISPDRFDINMTFGTEKKEVINIKNLGRKAFNVSMSLSGIADMIKIADSFEIGADEEKIIYFLVFGNDKRLRTGRIILKSEGMETEIPVIINVRSPNSLFAITARTVSGNTELAYKERLDAKIDIVKFKPEKNTAASVRYVIKDFSGKDYLEQSEEIEIFDSKSYIRSFDTQNLAPGKYVLGIELESLEEFSTANLEFEIKPSIWSPIIAVLSALALLTIAYFLAKRKINRPGQKKI